MSPITIGSTSCGHLNLTQPFSNSTQGNTSRFLSSAAQLSGLNWSLLLLTYRVFPLQSEKVFSKQVKLSHSKKIGVWKQRNSSLLASTTLILASSTNPGLGPKQMPG